MSYPKKNITYQMNEFLEWNNVLEIFEMCANCMHYAPKYLHLQDKSPNFEFDPDIINRLIGYEVDDIKEKLLHEKYKEHEDNHFFFFQPETKVDIANNICHLILKTTNMTIGHGTIVFDGTFEITDVLKKWKFNHCRVNKQ